MQDLDFYVGLGIVYLYQLFLVIFGGSLLLF